MIVTNCHHSCTNAHLAILPDTCTEVGDSNSDIWGEVILILKSAVGKEVDGCRSERCQWMALVICHTLAKKYRNSEIVVAREYHELLWKLMFTYALNTL